MPQNLYARLGRIRPVDASLEAVARARLDDLTKPKGSLGRLEDLAAQMFMVQGALPLAADPARVYTIAGDHGVVAEGVSLFPQEVTRQMVLNFVRGGAGINVLCRAAGVDIRVVDAGCLGGAFPAHETLIQRKVGPGTANMAQGPAMDIEQCAAALHMGMDLADEAAAQGVRTLGTGDMGIGNTTPSTALYCAFLGQDPAGMAGPGTGLAPEAVRRKAAVVKKALEANAAAVASGDPLRILAGLGGFEIAALAGLILGGASNGQMVCVDGFISTAAYLAADRLCGHVRGYCVLSHASAEPGHRKAARALGMEPLLDLGLRLGEGTGAAMSVFLLRCAAGIFNDMATFSQAGVSAGPA